MRQIGKHPYHLVDQSQWPILVSMTVFSQAYNTVQYLGRTGDIERIKELGIVLALQVIVWTRDIIREGNAGSHTVKVERGQKLGFILFVLSEIMQFVSFFWCYLHSSQAPAVEIGAMWPPAGIPVINYMALPLLGTAVLLGSSQVLTISHHAVISGNKSLATTSLQITVIQGAFFLVLQYNEYKYSEFELSDSIFGNIFFFTTGLHALHVIVGVLALGISVIRLARDNYTSEHHTALEQGVYYYHFVDVIWIIVYIIYYWFGS